MVKNRDGRVAARSVSPICAMMSRFERYGAKTRTSTSPDKTRKGIIGRSIVNKAIDVSKTQGNVVCRLAHENLLTIV